VNDAAEPFVFWIEDVDATGSAAINIAQIGEYPVRLPREHAVRRHIEAPDVTASAIVDLGGGRAVHASDRVGEDDPQPLAACNKAF
jgi:hypothetical protein